MRGETDVAPSLLRLREKKNTAGKVAEAKSGDRTNIGSYLIPHCQPCPSTQRPTAKKINSMTMVSTLSPRCWNLPSLGGIGEFPFGSSSSFANNGGTGSNSWDKERRKRQRKLYPCQITAFSPLLPRYWYLPSPRGLADFPLARPPSPPSTVSKAPSPKTRGRRRIRRTPRLFRLLILIWLVGENNTCGYCLRYSDNVRKQVLLWVFTLLIRDVDSS